MSDKQRFETAVFPAQAGMILGVLLSGAYRLGVPRASGDDPIPTTGTIVNLVCSPRKRG